MKNRLQKAIQMAYLLPKFYMMKMHFVTIGTDCNTNKNMCLGRLILSNEANEKLFRISGASCALKLLTKMIAHGPRQYSFHLDELTDVLKKGTEVFLHEPSLLEVGPSIGCIDREARHVVLIHKVLQIEVVSYLQSADRTHCKTQSPQKKNSS